MANVFWLKFCNDNHLPNILAEILLKTGYDNAISIRNLNNDRIDAIEKFVQRHLQPLDHLAYARMDVFEFLPGHRTTLLALPESIKKFEQSPTDMKLLSIIESLPLSFIMKELVRTAIFNANKDCKQRRFSETIQYFATYIYMHCGKACYEILSKNLPLPQANTTLNYINQKKRIVVEGELRCKELMEYLQDVGAPKVVWLSEDASGIVPKVSYHSATEQLIGLVLPTDSLTGCPQSFSYVPKCPEDFLQQMARPKSTLLYVIMAQPLKEGTQPFVLQAFGTDNSFTSHNVFQRWKHTLSELRKCGIQVAGISTDGDSRALTCMKNTLTMLKSPNADVFLDIESEQEVSVIQDPIHIATKLRNRMLKPSVAMPMGNKQVSVAHLKMLVHNVPKNTHGLVATDILPEDKQNYGSFEKITAPQVLEALERHVMDSEATIMYLKISKQIITAFTEVDVSPIDRIYRIWHSLYFMRAWRKWIEKKQSPQSYVLNKNFITNNSFTCIELNAYGLLHLIVKFRNMNAPHLFLTTLFQSQTCEKTFRQLRSMTTINWTRINFSLLEVFHLIGRIELQNDIVFNKLVREDVSFPRLKNRTDKFKIYPLPSNEDMKTVLLNALEQAIKDASKLGIQISEADINRCEIKRIDIREGRSKNMNNVSVEMMEEEASGNLACSNLRSYPHREGDIESDSRFIEIVDETGKTKTILKSSLVWLLSETKSVLSNDRLRRVQMPTTAGYRKRKRNVPISLPNNEETENGLKRSDEIKVGDWCFFHNSESNEIIDFQATIQVAQCKDIVYGLVVGFRYADGKTDKDRQYTLDYGPVSYNGIHKERGIEVLATWYKYNHEKDQAIIPASPFNSYFINLNSYIASSCAPLIVRENTSNISSYKLHQNFIETKEMLINIGNNI